MTRAEFITALRRHNFSQREFCQATGQAASSVYSWGREPTRPIPGWVPFLFQLMDDRNRQRDALFRLAGGG